MRGLGERIRERMERLEIDKKVLADRLGLTEKSIGNYINEKREPDLEGFVRLCMALATTPDRLLAFGSHQISAYTPPQPPVKPPTKREKRGRNGTNLRQKGAI